MLPSGYFHTGLKMTRSEALYGPDGGNPGLGWMRGPSLEGRVPGQGRAIKKLVVNGG